MSLPTPTKNYVISENNYIASNGPLPNNWQDRGMDIVKVLCTMTNKLISLGFATHVASSNEAGVSTDPLVNVWDIDNPANTTGITGSGNNILIYNLYNNTTFWYGSFPGPAAYSFWIILQIPSHGQLCMGFYWNGTIWKWKVSYSPGNLFNTAVSNLDIPTASDELLLDLRDYNAWHSIASPFNADDDGLLNSAQNKGSYNLQVQVVVADDSSGFWMGAFRDNECALFIYFTIGLDNPVGAPGTWDSYPIYHIDRSPIFNRVVVSASSFKSIFTGSSTWVFRGAALSMNNQWVRWNPLIDQDVNEYAIYPVPFYAFSPGTPTGDNTGLKGVMRDFWLGQTQASPALYPSTPPTQLVQVGDFILPWNTSTSAPLFI